MEYVFGVRSVLDGVSKFCVQSPNSAHVGDIVSFDTDDGEQFAIVEAVCFVYSTPVVEVVSYLADTVYPINSLFSQEYRRPTDAGTP